MFGEQRLHGVLESGEIAQRPRMLQAESQWLKSGIKAGQAHEGMNFSRRSKHGQCICAEPKPTSQITNSPPGGEADQPASSCLT